MIASLFLAVLLQWDWNTEPNLGGYRVYWGTEPDPIAGIDVGKVSKWNADNFLKTQPPGTRLYFVVAAYNTENAEGLPSNEVSYTVPLVIPSPSPTPTPAPSPTPVPTPEPPKNLRLQVILGRPTMEGYELEGGIVKPSESPSEMTLDLTYTPSK